MTLHSFVDWLSFTIDSPTRTDGSLAWLDTANSRIMQRQTFSHVNTILSRSVMQSLFPDGMLDLSTGRFPYKYQTVDPMTKARIMFDPGLAHILIELPGTSCQKLSNDGLLLELMANNRGRITRVDVSADIRTEVSPFEFAKERDGQRFKAVGTFKSETGQTVYIGSSKSDRYAAVYKYDDPHPRAGILRVEHRFRRDRATEIVGYMLQNGIPDAVAICGQVFGWQHPIWKPLVQNLAPLVTERMDRQSANAVRWLLTQVFPAMKRYEADGTIPDLRAFVQQYLFDDDAETP